MNESRRQKYMKYLKKFNEAVLDHSVVKYSWMNESSESEDDNLLEFTEDHLAYLIDDGFEIMTSKPKLDFERSNNLCTKITISKRSGFAWEEIVDRFSPFIYMLDKKYEILEVVFHQHGGRQYQYDSKKDIEELISGEAEQYLLNKFYYMIRIIVKKK